MNRTFTLLTRAASPEPSDSQLLDAFVTARDPEAFEGLVRRHGPMVLAVGLRVLRHRHDAEDAFQATFLVLARRAADVWPREAVGAWLHGVAYRVALKARGRRARQRVQPLGDIEPPAEGVPYSDVAAAIDRAVGRLPEVYRAAVVACDLEGLSRKAAAERLGWKEGTLSGRLARARHLLAAQLRRAGVTLPAGIATAGVCEPNPVVSAELTANAVRLGGGASAPVAALAQGVVKSMSISKVKAAATAVLAAGMIGLWATAGSGEGPVKTAPPAPKAEAAPVAKADVPARPTGKKAPGPRIELAVAELDVIARSFDGFAGKKVTPADVEQLRNRIEDVRGLLAPGKELLETPSDTPGMTDELKRLQGKWQIVSSRSKVGVRKPEVEDPRELVVEVRGNKVLFPYLGADGGIKHTETTIWRLDRSSTPKEIDLIEPQSLVQRGIYDLRVENGETTLVWAFGRWFRPGAFADPPEEVFETTFRRIPDEKPTATDLQKMQGGWWLVAMGRGGEPKAIDINGAADPGLFAFTILGNRFIPPLANPANGWRTGEAKIVLDPTTVPKRIDLVHEAGQLAGIYEFSEVGNGVILFRLRLGAGADRPTEFSTRSGATEYYLGRYADSKKDPASDADLRLTTADLAAAAARLQVAHAGLEVALRAIKDRPAATDLAGFERQLDQDLARVNEAKQLVEQAQVEVLKARLRAKPAPSVPVLELPKGRRRQP